MTSVQSSRKAQSPPPATPSKFIRKVYEMLSHPQHSSAISWDQSGHRFEIIISNFVEQVLPLYFKHANFESFIRQLNMYNFVREKKSLKGQKNSSEDRAVFSHRYFRRDDQVLLNMVKRKSEQKIKKRKRIGEKNENKSSERRHCRKTELSMQEARSNVYKLINFNRRLLDQNRSLWKLFYKKAKKASEQIDVTALEEDFRDKVDQLTEVCAKIGQHIESEASSLERNFEGVLRDYEAEGEIVRELLEGQGLEEGSEE